MTRPSKAVIAFALTLGVLCFAVSAKGYGMVIRYGWLFWLFFLLIIFGLRAFRRDGLLPFTLNIVIVVGVGTTGMLVGDWTRRTICFSKCHSCEPVLERLSAYRATHGVSPTNIPPNELPIGITFQQSRLTEGNLGLEGINEADATLYLGTNGFLCVVPVTKMLPISFTRFYAYVRNGEDRDWRYDYFVWLIGVVK